LSFVFCLLYLVFCLSMPPIPKNAPQPPITFTWLYRYSMQRCSNVLAQG
jgi:hypothetical protein